jgi:2-polyprenyl-3-methyl-5-hydroxy-6-metoxy-1,4-benzoquinol methylase
VVKEYYEDLWRRLPEALNPPDLTLRAGFLLPQLRPGQQILDLGCGDGAFSELMLEHAEVTVTAADVADAALERVAARPGLQDARRRGALSLQTVPFDGDLPFADNRFDLIWASEVIEHVADTGRWLSEVRRVLKPGSRLLVSTPNHTRLRLALTGIGAVSEPLGDHLHLYDRTSLSTVLNEFGFNPVAVRSAAGPGPMARLLLADAQR